MSKGIIVVDMPENCGRCSFCEKNKKWCTTKDVFIAYYYYRVSKPEWCPIKPMPEEDNKDYFPDELLSGIAIGWNTCIDKILEGAE